MSEPGDVTKLLYELKAGNREVESQLISIVYNELQRTARAHLRRERENHTLQPTELVNEAYVRLVKPGHDWQNRSHFFAVASQVMRRILVDHARARAAEKRGGSLKKVNIDDVQIGLAVTAEEVLDVDAALHRLSEIDPRQARVVELRMFGGLTEDEIADFLGVSSRTVKRDWRMARAWLYGEMRGHADREQSAER